MQVALCDDDVNVRNRLREWILCYGKEYGHDFSVHSFSSAEAYMNEGRDAPILFMDIYMPGIDGIQAVRNTSNGSTRQVVFITTSREHAIEAFGLDAVHYILKPLQKDDIWEALRRCLARMGQYSQQRLPVKTRQGTVEVLLERITYIEVMNKLCVIHTIKSTLETRISLDSLFEQLDGRFLRVQRSFVINMDYVDSFLSDRVVMQDGPEIMLTRHNRAELKKSYQDYLFHLARRDDV